MQQNYDSAAPTEPTVVGIAIHQRRIALDDGRARNVKRRTAQLSSDLQNMLAATDIATLFLDRDLRILRFTPKLSELFNIRTSDRGRPISDLTQWLGYPDLIADSRNVFSRLVPIERELQDDGGAGF